MSKTVNSNQHFRPFSLTLVVALALSTMTSWASSPQEIKKNCRNSEAKLFRDIRNTGQY